jgi:hypothetical protein
VIRRLPQFLFVLVVCLTPPAASAERMVMLVTNDSCEMDSISMLDVRKAYLGITVRFEATPVRAFRLNNDHQLSQIFYQTVVAMSEKSYERRLLSMLLKFGTPRPREFDDVASLIAALGRADCPIAYMWSDDVESASGVRNIRLLWQGD